MLHPLQVLQGRVQQLQRLRVLSLSARQLSHLQLQDAAVAHPLEPRVAVQGLGQVAGRVQVALQQHQVQAVDVGDGGDPRDALLLADGVCTLQVLGGLVQSTDLGEGAGEVVQGPGQGATRGEDLRQLQGAVEVLQALRVETAQPVDRAQDAVGVLAIVQSTQAAVALQRLQQQRLRLQHVPRLALHQRQIAQADTQAQLVCRPSEAGHRRLQGLPGRIQLAQVHIDQAQHGVHAGQVVQVAQAAAFLRTPAKQLQGLPGLTLPAVQHRPASVARTSQGRRLCRSARVTASCASWRAWS